MFGRVLIANRGEIAVRVARTLRRLGIESIAVYSDADAGAAHVRAADRALRIGPTAAAESYLSVERILDAARRAGAEALHPGYGFLSERPELSRACAAAGIAFVGPGPEAMALLGDKIAAKAAAQAAGVPVLPGLQAGGLGDAEIIGWAAGQRLPLLLKAAAGGGGRGMRVVRTQEELPEAIAAARREARSAFGDDRLLVERFVEGSRHIEVQLIADAHGSVLHLGERECSLQRRHQKVIEESPSPALDTELRARMGAAASALAASCGYRNAGTVELIAEREDPGSFYFLEMNARLQVEHPVTEAVTGLDLVELQLRVAAGEPLPLRQEEVELRGHAVEARVYAEDPANGFLPATGRVVAYREPVHGRIDSCVGTGSEVTSDYDPMLAKVIAHGPDRGAALAGLDRALGELVLLGPTTNTAYLRALLARPEVRAGELDTGLIERLGDAVAPPPPAPELSAVALALLLGGELAIGAGAVASDDPWDALDAWRPTGPAWIRATLAGPAGKIEVALRAAAVFCVATPDKGLPHPACPRRWEWRLDKREGSFEIAPAGPAESPRGEGVAGQQRGVSGDPLSPRADGVSPRADGGAGSALLVTVDGEARRLWVEREPGAVWLLDGAAAPARFALADEEAGAARGGGAGSLEAPMPGTVLELRRGPGEEVEEGDVLVVLESMKMELAVQSPRDGAVAEVLVAVGDRVARGEPLVELAAEPGAAPAPAIAREGDAQ